MTNSPASSKGKILVNSDVMFISPREVIGELA
jgi:hypothetical protein